MKWFTLLDVVEKILSIIVSLTVLAGASQLWLRSDVVEKILIIIVSLTVLAVASQLWPRFHSQLRRFGILLIVLFSLVAPLIPLQWLSVYLAIKFIGQAYSVEEYVSLYANTYALFSLTWGSIWAPFLCQRLYRWLERAWPRQNIKEQTDDKSTKLSTRNSDDVNDIADN